MKKNQKNSFILYYDYEEHLKLLKSDEERGKILMAIFEYKRTKKSPEHLEGESKMLFNVIRVTLDRDEIKWEEERQKRSEAGRKGGLASGESRRKVLEEDEALA